MLLMQKLYAVIVNIIIKIYNYFNIYFLFNMYCYNFSSSVTGIYGVINIQIIFFNNTNLN